MEGFKIMDSPKEMLMTTEQVIGYPLNVMTVTT
jgi:hypothetical protein